ncbi:MAG TPA: C1 family peptidase, partial [Candidatus Nanopelagicales bacterium]|nr:C1 family peptidase [Candidatus Nanopelagicales bacterium]
MCAAPLIVGGWLKDPADSRDRSLELILPVLQQRAGWDGGAAGRHVIPEYTPVSSQGLLSSCVANSWCDALEILRGLERPDDVKQLSRLFLYWNARVLHDATGRDAGTFLRAGAQQLKKLGICEEQYWPYDADRVLSPPPASCYTMASENRLTGFYRIHAAGEARLRAVELALRANHPVLFGTVLGKPFSGYRGGGHTFFAPARHEWTGRHAMVLTGVERSGGRRRFLVRNSWGETWGDAGHAWLDESYIGWEETQDLWVGTRMP